MGLYIHGKHSDKECHWGYAPLHWIRDLALITCGVKKEFSQALRSVNFDKNFNAIDYLSKYYPDLNNIWECACGAGHLAKVFDKYGKLGKASDIIDRGYGIQEDFIHNIFVNFNPEYSYNGDIATNPPYKYAKEFVLHALKIIPTGRKVCMFLKLTFLEGQERKDMFLIYPPKTVYVSSSRIKCAINGDFAATGESAACYAWFVWEKGFTGKPVIEWIN